MKTLEQIRSEGFEALLKALGPVDTIRFFQQFQYKRKFNYLQKKCKKELERSFYIRIRNSS